METRDDHCTAPLRPDAQTTKIATHDHLSTCSPRECNEAEQSAKVPNIYIDCLILSSKFSNMSLFIPVLTV